METERTGGRIDFKGRARCRIQAAFDGGHISLDGGSMLLREADERFGLSTALAHCFTDHCDPDRIPHSLADFAGQRVLGLALGMRASMITMT